MSAQCSRDTLVGISEHRQSFECGSAARILLAGTTPTEDLCVPLEGGYNDSSSACLSVLNFENRLQGYRGQCEATHLGEGRCAFTSTHLARHTHVHTRTYEEGAYWRCVSFNCHLIIVACALTLFVQCIRIDLLFSSGRSTRVFRHMCSAMQRGNGHTAFTARSLFRGVRLKPI